MTDTPQALIDTNVIIDILGGDPDWMEWSASALAACETAFVNPIVFAELCYFKSSPDAVEQLLGRLTIDYQELPKDALFLAAQAFRQYRNRGGLKTAPLPDFFIGAHGVASGVPVVSRDVTRYATYFPTLTLIHP